MIELLPERQRGFSLEQSYYVDPQLFAVDMERIFRRHWLLAGPECRLPKPGDYFTYDIGHDSIIILRDEQGEIRAHHNVCRHRGSRICLTQEGSAKQLVCPYHQWSYKLDGSLTGARHLPKEQSKATLGLHPVQVQVVAGLVFVCLADSPPDFAHTAADVSEFLTPHALERTKVCHRTVETIRANWKVVAENFWECYHCAGTHPEFCTVMSYAHGQNSERLAEQQKQFETEWTELARRQGSKIGRVEPSERGLHRGGRLPIRAGYQTQSKDGKPLAPLLGDYTQYDGGITSFMHFPIIWYVVSNDYALLTRFTPLSTLETELELTWLVHEDAVEGRDYNVDDVCWLWRVTAEQDRTICENNQLGILSSRYQPGPYTETEGAVDEFVSWYLNELEQETAPW